MPKVKPQLGLLDDMLEDESLAAKLVEWGQAKEALRPHREKFHALDKLVKSEILEKGLEPGEHRCGVYVITISDREPREVSFERASGTTIRIKTSPILEGDE